MTAASSVQIVIEGPYAEAAARDFFSRGWFEAEWERRRDGAGGPFVSAEVVAIAGGSSAIAEKVLGWWARWREDGDADGARLAVAIKTASGAGVSLETASRAALADVLRVLQASTR